MVKSFTDLQAWQSAHMLALFVYKVTEPFPGREVFGLSSQARRAVVSVGSNIAEGFGRKSAKDRQHFFVMASGSLYELKSQALLARDLGYINDEDFTQLTDLLNQTHKLINGLLRSHRI